MPIARPLMQDAFYLEPFLMRALLAGLGVALLAGPLGCFVVWRRMAYFGDSLSHSALLGVALGLLVGMDINIGIILVCSAFAVLLVWLQRKKILATDTLLGILAHSALSLGVVAISFLDTPVDLHAFLFGDILAVTGEDVIWVFAGACAVVVSLVFLWRKLLLATINEDLARAEGIETLHIHLLLVAMMAVVVATSLQIVGILLITSLLIIPAATARQVADSPESMAIIATLAGHFSVVFGLYGSYRLDAPSGPSIVVASAVFFVCVTLFAAFRRQRRPH